MPKNDDFLYTLKEEMPHDFATALRKQLNEADEIHTETDAKNTRPTRPSWWVLAVASLATLLFGVLLFSSRINTLDVLNIMPWLPREPITADTVDQLEPFATQGHGTAQHIALSTDDSTLAIASTTGIYLHDANNLQAEPQFIGMPDDPTDTGIRHLEYINDNRLMIVTESNDGSGYALFEWDADTNDFIALYGVDRRPDDQNPQASFYITHVDLAPDGSRMLIAYCNRGLGIFAETGARFCTAPQEGEFQSLGTISIDMIDFDDPTQALAIMLEDVGYTAVAIHPDWNRVAYLQEGTIYLYDHEAGTTQAVVSIQDAPNYFMTRHSTLAFSPDGDNLTYSGAHRDDYQTWTLDRLTQTEDEIAIYVPEQDVWGEWWSSDIAFHPQTGNLILAHADRVTIFADDESTQGVITSSWRTTDILINTTGDTLYGLSSTGMVQAWAWDSFDTRTSTTRYTLPRDPAFTFSPNSQFFVSYGRYMSTLGMIGNISGDTLSMTHFFLDGAESAFAMPVEQVAISHDSRFIAYIQQSALYVYDSATDTHTEVTSATDLFEFGFRTDGSLVTLDSQMGYVNIRNYSREMLISGEIPYVQEPQRLTDLSLGSMNNDGWLLNQYRPGYLTPDGDRIVFNRCGGRLISDAFQAEYDCRQPDILIVDAITGETVTTLPLNAATNGFRSTIAFSNNRQYVGVGYCTTREDRYNCAADSYQVDVWQLATLGQDAPDPYMRFTDLQPLRGLNFHIVATADTVPMLVTENSEHIAPFNNRFYTQFWTLDEDGNTQELVRLDTHNVAFSPDGRIMVSLADGRLQLWDVSPDALLTADE